MKTDTCSLTICNDHELLGMAVMLFCEREIFDNFYVGSVSFIPHSVRHLPGKKNRRNRRKSY